MKLMIDLKKYTGTPVEIVGFLWDENFHRDQLPTIDSYIAYAAQNIFKFTGKGYDVGTGTIEEKCQRLLDGMVSIGIAAKVEE
jgi:hypothetical protein